MIKYISTLGDLQIFVLFLIFSITFIIWKMITAGFKDKRPKWLLGSLFVGIFFYSGWGIAYKNVPDEYIIIYTIFILTLGIPFLIFRKPLKSKDKELCAFDRKLLNGSKTLEGVAIIYLLLNLIPLIYPDFKLFDIFRLKVGSIHTLRDATKGYFLLSLSNTLSILIAPFFYAFFTVQQKLHPKSKKPIIFFIILIILQFGRFNYIARNEMLLDIVNIIMILYCVKGFKFKFSLKIITVICGVIIVIIPFLYLYTFIRMGATYTGDTSFANMTDLLVKSEFYYPNFYEDILRKSTSFKEDIIDFINYIICLPIPNAIWPTKPGYHAISSFTQSFTGLERGDTGFFILLPSIIGEALIYGGKYLFWLFSLISGYIIALIYRYLCSKKTLTYYTFFIIVYAFTYARGGTMGLLPMLINGSICLFVFDLIISGIKK